MALTFTPGISKVIGTASQLSGSLSDPITSTQVSGQMTASQGGTALSSIGSNQIAVGGGSGVFAATVLGERLLAYSTALQMTASGDDVMTMSNAANLGSYIVRRVTWANPVSAALATVIVVATLRTASGNGGSAITGNLVVTGLSATTAYLDQVVTLASSVITASQLYVSVTTAAGTAPLSSLFIWGHCLGV